MSVRVTMLDPEWIAASAAHADGWAARALGTDPADLVRWEAGARACYQYAGVRWPGQVVRVASPLALARALFLARINEVPGDEDRALVGPLRRANQDRVDRVLGRVFGRPSMALARRAVFLPVDAAVPMVAVAQAVDDALRAGPLPGDPAGTRESASAAARRVTGTHKLGLVDRLPPATWRAWTLHFGGRWEAAWSAYASFLAAAYSDPRAKGWRRRIRLFEAAQSAGWWWPGLDFVMVSDPPVMVRTEQVAGQPPRPHCADGPAVVWGDGWHLYFWHGTRVPAWVVERPSIDAIHAEPNVEVRRCGIEALGWDAYIAGAGLRLVDTSVDPGNPGCELRLYDLPERVWGTPTGVLLATNGSPERDGSRRRYGLPVPAGLGTAVDAAAWTYGLTGDRYGRLVRRT